VPADDVTMTCTERDGFRIVFRWGGTRDALDFTLVDGTPDARRVWEGTPWVRVP
jgi:hypothetical protein